jgi:hypothetical protein
MKWKLMMFVILIVIVVVSVIASKSTSEDFDEGMQSEKDVPSPTVSEAYTAGSVAFDAYNEVHGRPPLSEALDHYRKIAQDGKLTKEQMVKRINSDMTTLPASDKPEALKVTAKEVNTELHQLRAYSQAAGVLNRPMVPPSSTENSIALSTRLADIATQLKALAEEMKLRNSLTTPSGLESFIAF